MFTCVQVCVMSADFWGLKTAGGTATAYHLLAAMLAKSHALEVPPSKPCSCCVLMQFLPCPSCTGLCKRAFVAESCGTLHAKGRTSCIGTLML